MRRRIRKTRPRPPAEPGAAPGPLQVGDHAERELLLTAEDIDRYATELGDPNFLHHDEAASRQTRFGGLIASGGHLLGLLTSFGAAFTTSRGQALGLEFSYRLRKAARTGETLRLRWEVVAIEASPKLGGDLLTLRAEIRDGHGVLLVIGRGLVLAAARL